MDPETSRLHARLIGTRRRFGAALSMVDAHLAAHGGHVAWSGGKDSTVVADIAHTVRPGTPIVTYVAGTEYPEVLPYCEAVAIGRGWSWATIQTADVTELLDDGVRPSDGGAWWDAMIAGPATIAHSRYGPGLLWGLRADESAARAAMLYSTRGVHDRKDGVTTCAPLWRWAALDVYAYLAAHDVALCPTYARMADVGMPPDARRVGRIIGRRNMQERLLWLQRGWPDTYTAYIERWPWLTGGAQ